MRLLARRAIAPLAALAAVLLVILAACGRSVDGGTCTGPIGYPFTASCTQCLATACKDEMQNAYGGDWQVPHLGGACGSYTACRCACVVQDVTCAVRCAVSESNDCIAARSRLATCVDKSCRAPCTPQTTDGGIPDGPAPRG